MEQKNFETVDKRKTSVITKKNTHHGSSGSYVSFGNLCIYRTIDDSSVGQYCIKNNISCEQVLARNVLEELIGRELSAGILLLKTVLPKLRYYIAPVFELAYKVQDVLGSINLKGSNYKE